ncbi:hypothetical protein FOZ61_001685 [Perkinsus olseni]|uniref:ATP-grasp domain-containing protein n=1 Tax=Perkinsus olseni TaxID=32597 RepID=A0A7J6LVT9_PEROL|nr:hypothetical protein FOZ61_001685 [Perkinsus olseni]
MAPLTILSRTLKFVLYACRLLLKAPQAVCLQEKVSRERIIAGTKRLDFPIFLKTRATVPGAGTVRAEGNGTAHAIVSNKKGLNELMAIVSAEGTAGSLSSRVMFFPFIRTNFTALDHWNYSADITVNISAGRNQSHYAIFSIFNGWV